MLSVETIFVSISDKRLKLENNEMVVFEDKTNKGKCNAHKTKSGRVQPVFPTSLKRSNVLQQFLAYWSEELGTYQLEDKTKESFLYLKFCSDLEILQASKDPTSFKHKLEWKQISSVDTTEDTFKYLAGHKYDPTVITLVLIVTEVDTEKIIFTTSFKFKPFELFVNVLLPWKLPVKFDKDDEEVKTVTTHLSMYQSKLFLDEKNRCTFYPTDNPKLFEPYITSNNARNNIIYEIISLMSDRGIFKKEKDAKDKNKIITLRFRDGDREFANTLVDMNNNKFWSFEDLDVFKDEVKLNLIKSNIEIAEKNNNDEHVFLVEFYTPKTDEIYIYTSFARKIPEPRNE